MVFRDFNPINIKNKTCKSLQDKMTIFNPGEIMKAKIIKLLRLKKKKILLLRTWCVASVHFNVTDNDSFL